MALGLLVSLAMIAPQAKTVNLTSGLVIRKSCKVTRAVFNRPGGDDEGKKSVIVVKGDNLIVDFNGATLLGTPLNLPPDQRAGTGVQIQGKNVTIKNLNVHGYKIGLIARNCAGLRLVNCDFSYNWKQHLLSTIDREDLSDWMSYHHNEKDEWLRYGAGIYLRGCTGFEVKDCTIEGGQCGLMITDCNKGRIWNNSFSFLSAIGLGMYRSSDNKIMHNNIDWCVRGYSHGKWNRGQDSAGILIYEQSNRNTFAYNSVTHGGDGFFLWAGQTTMDDGSGGCNRNLLYGNDFSHAPTNGIEATFSANDFVNNLVLECWHGIWGGYSWDSRVIGNIFGQNAQAIAWEHGQNNAIQANMFYRDTEAIALWMNKTQDPSWGYAKAKDTRSRDWQIAFNEFNNIPTNALSIRDTTNVSVAKNSFSKVGTIAKLDGENPNFEFKLNEAWIVKGGLPEGAADDNKLFTGPENEPEKPTMQPSGNVILGLDPDLKDYLDRFNVIWMPYPTDPVMSRGLSEDQWLSDYVQMTRPFAPKPLAGGKRPFLKPNQLRGRRYILVDDWGPYDFKSPILWPRGEGAASNSIRFEILGPKGAWRVKTLRGVKSVSAQTGTVPGFIEVNLEEGKANDILVELEYKGGAIRTPFGEKIAAGTPYPFRFSKFVAPIDWEVKFWAYDGKTQDPRTQEAAWREIFKGAPIKTLKTTELNYAWGGSPAEGVPADHFATMADGTFEVAPGKYELNVTSDDGVRVFVDGKKVIENWTWHGPTLDQAVVNLTGKHRIRVEHFELDGYSALKVELKPKR